MRIFGALVSSFLSLVEQRTMMLDCGVVSGSVCCRERRMSRRDDGDGWGVFGTIEMVVVAVADDDGDWITCSSYMTGCESAD